MRLLWRNVYLNLLRIFCLGCLVFCYWLVCVVSIFWRLSPCRFHNLWLFSPIPFFFFFMVSIVFQKLVSLISSQLFIFVLFLLPWGTDLRKYLHALCQRFFSPFFCCLAAYRFPRPGIRAVVLTYTTAAATPDPLTHCAGLGIQKFLLWLSSNEPD